LEDIVAPLSELPEDERPYSAARFVDFAGLLKRVQIALLTRDPSNERLQDQDCLLLTYLAAYFNGVAASPAVLNGDLLERALVASGVVLPFAGPSQSGGAAAFGVPSNVTPDVLCDSVSELARMAAAALLALYVYLNFRRGPNDLPSDEAVLVFATIGALIGFFGCEGLRWCSVLWSSARNLIELSNTPHTANTTNSHQLDVRRRQRGVPRRRNRGTGGPGRDPLRAHPLADALCAPARHEPHGRGVPRDGRRQTLRRVPRRGAARPPRNGQGAP
jgi:hypothetical protein